MLVEHRLKMMVKSVPEDLGRVAVISRAPGRSSGSGTIVLPHNPLVQRSIVVPASFSKTDREEVPISTQDFRGQKAPLQAPKKAHGGGRDGDSGEAFQVGLGNHEAGRGVTHPLKEGIPEDVGRIFPEMISKPQMPKLALEVGRCVTQAIKASDDSPHVRPPLRGHLNSRLMEDTPQGDHGMLEQNGPRDEPGAVRSQSRVYPLGKDP